jgi:phage terminase large subunit GpA-like protein
LTDDGAISGLPPFCDPEEGYQRASAVLLPRKRMKPSEAAEKYRFLDTGGSVGPWRNASAPYMVEPMDCTSDREYQAVVFAGPARSSKTAALVMNTLVHRIMCDPCDIFICQTSQNSARQFSREHIDRMNRMCPDVNLRLSKNADEDNIYDKRYQGMSVYFGWPTVDQVAGKDYQVILDTEYDRKPEDIGGEGSLFNLERKRTQTFGSLGKLVVECSPSRDIIPEAMEKWTPRGHEAPPTTGILELFNQGDRRLYYWPCPECDEFFEPKFSQMDYLKAEKGQPPIPIEEAAASVVMVCPHCGCRLTEQRKGWMNSNGVWLREGQQIDADRQITGVPRKSSIASFWLKGPAASFQSWSSLTGNYLQALESYERTRDYQTLKTVVNVDHGEPFLVPAEALGEVIDKEELKARAEADWSLGTVPAGVRALVVTVDVQGRYFDVQVTGYGVDFECWIVDRFQISQSAEDGRLVDPGSYPEDWNLLWPLLTRAWPLAADPSREMAPLCVMIDSGGAPGVTGNAYGFAVKARKAGIGEGRLMILKGDAKVGAKRVYMTKVDWNVDGKVMARGLKLLLVGSDDLKDDVAGALRRESPGAGYVHTPHNLQAEWFDQVTAEQRTEKGWIKRPGMNRNEALDHMVYSRAGLLRAPWWWGRINWAAPQSFAQSHDKNSLVRLAGNGPSPAPAAPPQGAVRTRGLRGSVAR